MFLLFQHFKSHTNVYSVHFKQLFNAGHTSSRKPPTQRKKRLQGKKKKILPTKVSLHDKILFPEHCACVECYKMKLLNLMLVRGHKLF